MTGRPPTTPDAFDDDRLLALALGVNDDPELDAAVASRPELEQRLARMRGDIDSVTQRLHAAIPETPDDYAEPSADRWPGLQSYFTPAAPSRGRRGRGRLAAALAAAALLALIVGIGVTNLGDSSRDAETGAGAPESRGEAAGAPAADKGSSGTFWAGKPIVLPEAEHFKAVVVARAGEIAGGLQRFAVVRVLKGRVTDDIALLVHEGAKVMPAGTLEVLYMRPLRDYVMAGVGPEGYGPDEDGEAGAGATPGASVATAGNDGVVADAAMPAPAAGYSMGDTDAYVQALPEGVDVTQLSVR